MPAIFATDSCCCQQLICAENSNNVQPMVATTKEDFAKRLHKACDNAALSIPEERGRRVFFRFK